MEIALQLYCMEDNDYNNDGYNYYNGYNIYGSNNNGYNNNIVEELEYELQLLWTTFSSLFTKLTSPPPAAINVVTPSHRTAIPRATSNTATPFINAIFDTTSSGGVHCLSLHLHNVLGIPLPPPKMSQSNSPHLHTSTLAYH